MLILLSQVEMANGLAGWSSFGISGLVLAWLLLKHLPEKDRQVDSMLSRFDARLLKEQEKCDLRIDAINQRMDGMYEFMHTRAQEAAKRKGITQ